jgi:hypothetical protein
VNLPPLSDGAIAQLSSERTDRIRNIGFVRTVGLRRKVRSKRTGRNGIDPLAMPRWNPGCESWIPSTEQRDETGILRGG